MKEILFTFLLSMTPIIELRGSIPFGMALGVPVVTATLVSIIGLGISATILVFTLPFFVRFFYQINFFKKILDFIFTKTRNKHSNKFRVMGEIFLIIFIAIPIPGSGAWTGVLVAYLFDLPKKNTLIVAWIGIICSGLIVAGLSSVIKAIYNLLW